MVPEYAREYVEKLGGPCTYQDVEHIARQQQTSYETHSLTENYVFFDTWLIITRVWFEVVFHKVPSWIDDKISQASFDLVLICHTDLPWIGDGVRENGGAMRDILQERYLKHIQHTGWNCFTVRGAGEERLTNAIRFIDNTMADD
jgi:nicotinamide riboside kinase